MISSTIKAVVFDAVGTLLHPLPTAGEVYAAVGGRLGSRYAREEVARRFAVAFAAEEERDRAANLRTSEERELQRWQAIVATVLDDVHDPQRCFAELYEHFGRPSAWRCEADAHELLATLTARGLQVALASNYDHRLHAVAAGFPELRRLNPIVISSEVGWRKPAAGFFAALCQALHLPPEHIVYVGDDPVNDVAGATAAGLQAILFDPAAKHEGATGRRLHEALGLR